MKHEIVFPVTVCLGGGDGGDICVTVEVLDKEYAILKECCMDELDLGCREELSELIKRIEIAAQSECEDINDEYGDTDEDYSLASFIIGYPDEIIEICEEEMENMEDFDDD